MAIADVATEQQLLEQEYDRVVREDIELFRSQAALKTAGKMTDDELRPQRLPRGVYSQRQPDVHMIRTKVPGGLLTSDQMRQMGRVADEFAGGRQGQPQPSGEIGDADQLLGHHLGEDRAVSRGEPVPAEGLLELGRHVDPDALEIGRQ